MYKLLTHAPKNEKIFLDYNEEMKRAILSDIRTSTKHLSQMRKNEHVFFCDAQSAFLVYHNESTGKIWTARIRFSEKDCTLIEPEPNEILLMHEIGDSCSKRFLYKIVEVEIEKVQHSWLKTS
jgi:hypothetical protein